MFRNFIMSFSCMLFTLVAVMLISSRGQPEVTSTNLEQIPMYIAEYSGRDDFFSPAVYEELNADHHVYRHYTDVNGNKVDLYIGYYGTKKGGRTPHNPYACLPGAGWGIVKTGKVLLAPPYLKDPIQVNYIMAVKDNLAESVLHWYQSSGTKVLSTGFSQNINRLIGKIFYNRNDGAFVRISSITPLIEIEKADTLTREFAQEIISLLPRYWPVEI